MPRVLICTVGGQPQPVVNAIRESAPLDHVYFLCSVGSSQNASARTITTATERKISGTCPHCKKAFVQVEKVRPLAKMAQLQDRDYQMVGVEDPDDLLQVLEACESIEKDIAERWPEGRVEVIANYTGGTKTMSLGLGFYALRHGEAWSLQLNRVLSGGRTDLIRVEAGDQAIFQDVSRLLADSAAERARTLEERHDYEGAVSVLSTALTHERLRREDQQRLLAQHLRSKLLAARERFDYDEALLLTHQDQELKAQHQARLKLLRRIVASLASEDAWPSQSFSGLELVDDLRDNANRAAFRGRYDDAVGRLYRATELLAQLRLRRCFDLRTAAVDLADPRIPESTRDRLAASYEVRELPDGRSIVKLGLIAAFELLAELKDALGRYFREHRGTLLNLIEKRNHSLFAHGLVPIDQATWESVGPRWQAWLDGAQEIL